jgi:hypothetical protein
MQDLETILVLIPEALSRQDGEDVLGGQRARAGEEGVGTFGRPSGSRSNGFCAV